MQRKLPQVKDNMMLQLINQRHLKVKINKKRKRKKLVSKRRRVVKLRVRKN